MPEQNNGTAAPAMIAPPRGNLKSHEPNNNNNGENGSAIKEVIVRVESIKTSLRQVLSDLNDTLPLLREAIKEKKATEKEIASVRSTIRSLQSVDI